VDAEDVTQILRQAASAVEASELPEDLRVSAFTAAVQLLTLAGGLSPPARPAAAGADPGSDSPIARIAAGLNIDVSQARDAFDVSEDGELWVLVPRSKFPKSKAPAMRQLALLVASARQLAGLEEWTSSDVLRDQCRQFGVFDRSNFAAELASMQDLFVMRGKGQQREFRVTRAGLDEVRRFVDGGAP
jgi:hypothetical protein